MDEIIIPMSHTNYVKFLFRMSGSRNRKSMTPKGKKGLKEIWKRDEEDPNLINLTNQNGDIDDEVLILDSILTARIHPHRLHPSELVEGKDFLHLKPIKDGIRDLQTIQTVQPTVHVLD